MGSRQTFPWSKLGCIRHFRPAPPMPRLSGSSRVLPADTSPGCRNPSPSPYDRLRTRISADSKQNKIKLYLCEGYMQVNAPSARFPPFPIPVSNQSVSFPPIPAPKTILYERRFVFECACHDRLVERNLTATKILEAIDRPNPSSNLSSLKPGNLRLHSTSDADVEGPACSARCSGIRAVADILE